MRRGASATGRPALCYQNGNPSSRWTAMFRPCRSERYRLQTIDRAIQLVEDHIARMEALSATLAAVGRDEDAAYARALLRLGRSYLDLLCRSRHWLLSRERPRGEGWATTEAALLNTLRRWGAAEPYRAGPSAFRTCEAGGNLDRTSPVESGLT
jgi:hypothetical protein